MSKEIVIIVLVSAWFVLSLNVIFPGILEVAKRFYKGSNVKIQGSRNLRISEDRVKFEASSPEFFFFRKIEGDVFYGVPINENHDYYVAEQRDVPGGEWLVVTGSATVNITAEKEMTVTVTHPHPWITFLPFLIFPLLVGFLFLFCIFVLLV